MGRSKKAAADASKDVETNQKEAYAAAQAPAKVKKASKASKAAAASAAAPKAAAADSLSSKKRAAKDEIDAIFASSKKAAAAERQAEEQLNPELQQLAAEVGAARQAAQASGKRPKVEGSKDDIFGEQTGKSRKRTEEGYAVYSEEELGLGKKGGGDTALCPFDCDCCF